VSIQKRAKNALQKAAHLVENARVKRLSVEEKRALLAMLRGVSLADGVLAAAEHDALQSLATRLDVPLATISEISVKAAVERLARSPRVLALACLVVADTFFVDGDFDPSEKEFVASFAKTHGLSTNPLHDAVEKLRRQKLDDAVSEWSDSIS
jgi:tellurite resistance protein